MKKFAFIIAAAALAALAGCDKFSQGGVSGPDDNMIAFSVAGDDIRMEVSTKATAVTSVSKVWWAATSGTAGSDTKVHEPEEINFNTESNKFVTGYYWPSTETNYNFYVSNAEFTWTDSSHKAEIAATNATDIVAGTAAATWKSAPTVTLDHIFARTGSLTLTPESGYEIIGTPVWKIKSNTNAGTGGTYNIRTKAFSGVTALSEQAFTSTSDLYLVPGSYHVTITYTLKKGDYEKEFTKGADVTLTAGKINKLAATAITGQGEGAEDIVFTVSVTAWSGLDVTLPELS